MSVGPAGVRSHVALLLVLVVLLPPAARRRIERLLDRALRITW